MELYVKSTSNYPAGFPLTHFKRLGPTWEGQEIVLPFGEGPVRRHHPVVGWTDLFMGRPCSVKVARVLVGKVEGFLVWGGNSGLRILCDRRKPEEWEAPLPTGRGMPIIWIDAPADLPEEVREAVTRRRNG